MPVIIDHAEDDDHANHDIDGRLYGIEDCVYSEYIKVRQGFLGLI